MTTKAQQSKNEKESRKANSGYHESRIEMEASRSQGQNVQNSSIGKTPPPKSCSHWRFKQLTQPATSSLSLSYATQQSVCVFVRDRERGEIFAAVCLVVNGTIGNVCPLQRISRERDSSGVCICRGDFSSLGGVWVGVIALSLKTQTQQSVSTRTETVFHLSSTSLPTKQTDSCRKRGMNTHTHNHTHIPACIVACQILSQLL